MNAKKEPGQRRKNAGLSLHPELIALLNKHRGRKTKSQYAEEIIETYFRQKSGKLTVSERERLGPGAL